MPGRSTMEAIFLISQLMQRYMKQKKKLHMDFTDLEKAYCWRNATRLDDCIAQKRHPYIGVRRGSSPPPRAGAHEEELLGPTPKGWWDPLFLIYPYTLMGWQHTFIHEVAQRPSRPKGMSYYNILTPPTVTTQTLQMLRLDLNSLNTEEGRHFVKMSMNCDVVGT
jgi:hypothetical protein